MIIHRNISTTTDEEYFNRFILFHLNDGRIISSREINFHGIELKKIKMMELNIRGRSYRIRKEDLPDSFVEFIHHRTKGTAFIYNKEVGLSIREEFNSWSIGWTDGKTEFLIEIDFQTGLIIRKYEQPLTDKSTSHLHPQSLVLERGYA